MILESYAEVDSKQFLSGKTPHQLVQCSTVPLKKKYKYVNQHTIPFTNNQKFITCWATTVSCEFNWIYHAHFRLISIAAPPPPPSKVSCPNLGGRALQPFFSPPGPYAYEFTIFLSSSLCCLRLCFSGVLQEGIVIIDSPGVGESAIMDEIVKQYLPQAFAFIYVINSANRGGVQKDRVSVKQPCKQSFATFC